MSSPSPLQQLSITFADTITEVGGRRWNALTGTGNPFTRYEFLAALENNGCTTAETGWQPRHIIIRTIPGGDIVTLVPLYIKTNSWGEYVFDWSWADAYRKYGLDYYPKFVTAAPFTPSVGKRFFIAEGYDEATLMGLVTEKIREEARILGVSSWHILFPDEEQHRLLTGLDLMPRSACQFHWYNRGYGSFDDFLTALNSRKRKNIRKERKRVYEAGIQFKTVEGADIDEALWREFYIFYNSTYLMRGMRGYLTRDFFMEVGTTMPEQLVMICAMRRKELIAAALFFKNGDTLFGRYWGSGRDYRFLHFETCYYRGQDYAIGHGLKHFDSGAQGEHKIQRGFEPITTYSNHWIANTGFRNAIAEFLAEEKRHIERYGKAATELLPFKEMEN